MEVGTVAVVALVAGFSAGAVGASLVGIVEGSLQPRQPPRTTYECVGPG